MLESRNPASLHLCTLLSKPDRREVEVPVRYIGFEVQMNLLLDMD